MARKQFKKFQVVVTYKIECNEDYQPSVKDEKHNWKSLIGSDPEIAGMKIEVKEIG